MASTGASLGGLLMIAGGAVLSYSGVNDPQGGPVGVVKAILSGQTPKPGIQTVTTPIPAGAIGAAAAAAAAAGGAVGANGSVGSIAAGALGATGTGAKVVAIAESYKGVPYLWGGASRNGIDCSGLVLVAYRDGAGISLPHLATAQAARGTRIPREQVQPGDLVAWGVPGYYPHIAIATGYNSVVVAPHTGTVVQDQVLWDKKVPGFGYPDIYRIGGV